MRVQEKENMCSCYFIACGSFFRGFILQNRFPLPLSFHSAFDLNAWKIVFIYAARFHFILPLFFFFFFCYVLSFSFLLTCFQKLTLKYTVWQWLTSFRFWFRYCQRTVKWNRQNRYFDCIQNTHGHAHTYVEGVYDWVKIHLKAS